MRPRVPPTSVASQKIPEHQSTANTKELMRFEKSYEMADMGPAKSAQDVKNINEKRI